MNQFIQVIPNNIKENTILGELHKKFYKDFERECNINFHINMFKSCNIELTRKEAEEVVDDIYNGKI